MRASVRALYAFYLHLERERSSRWDRNCQRNSAADQKLFITPHKRGGGGVQFSKRPNFGGSILKIHKMWGEEILRHGTSIPCKCCQTIFSTFPARFALAVLCRQQNFTRTELLRPLYWIASVKPTGLPSPPPPMHLASSRTRVQTEITAMVQFIVSPLPFSSERKIWPFHVAVVQKRQRNFQKAWCTCRGVISLIGPIAFLTFPLLPPS